MSVKVLCLALLLAAARAFVPAGRRAASSVSMNMEMSKSMPFLKKPANLDGMIGNVEFDPLGFSDTYDVKWLREAELKHGRISMLAVVGWLVQAAGVHLPSPDGLYDTANPIDAFFHVGPSVMGQIFLFIGALESTNHMGKMGMMDMHKDSTREVGMFENPIYGAKQLKGKTPAQVADLKLKELKNGRLAMCAIGGLVHQTIIQGCETFGAFPNPQLWGEGQFVHAGGPGLFGL